MPRRPGPYDIASCRSSVLALSCSSSHWLAPPLPDLERALTAVFREALVVDCEHLSPPNTLESLMLILQTPRTGSLRRGPTPSTEKKQLLKPMHSPSGAWSKLHALFLAAHHMPLSTHRRPSPDRPSGASRPSRSQAVRGRQGNTRGDPQSSCMSARRQKPQR